MELFKKIATLNKNEIPNSEEYILMLKKGIRHIKKDIGTLKNLIGKKNSFKR